MVPWLRASTNSTGATCSTEEVYIMKVSIRAQYPAPNFSTKLKSKLSPRAFYWPIYFASDGPKSTMSDNPAQRSCVSMWLSGWPSRWIYLGNLNVGVAIHFEDTWSRISTQTSQQITLLTIQTPYFENMQRWLRPHPYASQEPRSGNSYGI